MTSSVALTLLCVITFLALERTSALSPPLPSFCNLTLEYNFNYVGNDIANEPHADVSECCNACKRIPNCKAFSWTNYHNGTCWLKSGQGKIEAAPGVVSAVILGPVPSCQTPELAMDYVGNDIGAVPSADVFGCCDKCRQYPGCRVFTHTNYNGGTCWLKSHVTYTAIKAGAQSMYAYPRLGTPCALWPDTDFEGNDLANVPAPRAENCCGKCSQTPGCLVYTWTNHNGGTCWLKNRQGPVRTKAGASSGLISVGPESTTCALEQGVDYVGNDVGSAASSDPNGCCSICLKQYPTCRAYSWTNYNGGTCWLKAFKGQTVANPNVWSAQV